MPAFKTPDDARALLRSLLEASDNHDRLRSVVPPSDAKKLLRDACRALRAEDTVIDIPGPKKGAVWVVGDLHGQVHDLETILDLCGAPSKENILIFNGDFVDRGSWGVEVLLVLAALKAAAPQHVFLLRGNHEATGCVERYGFKREAEAKYGADVFACAMDLFKALPLLAIVGQTAMIVHGGLWRKASSRKLALGSIAELRALNKRDRLKDDFYGCVFDELLWSDPRAKPGLVANSVRGGGLLWGPDVTDEFLGKNKLRLVVRSHEGPDARVKREGEMPSMEGGYTVDHEVPNGKLVTVFSAPDYPQFQREGERHMNRGAIVCLRAPALHEPEAVSFEAKKRPENATCFYDFENVPDSDEGSVCSGGSDSAEMGDA